MYGSQGTCMGNCSISDVKGYSAFFANIVDQANNNTY